MHFFLAKADVLDARPIGLLTLVILPVSQVGISSLPNLLPYCTTTLLGILLNDFSRPSPS